MQPYLFPYIGYYQMIAAVDQFIVYDNIKYTKKGWINRNRILRNGRDAMFSLPLKRDSDYLNVGERELAPGFDRDKLLNELKGAYLRAPYFAQTFALIEKIVRHEDTNLFRFLHQSIIRTCEHLGIGTNIRISSSVPIDHGLRNQEKVLAICEAVGANTYVNAIGGTQLYSKEAFRERGIDLKFVQSGPFEYVQFDNVFVPGLSIIDVMMFNPLETIQTCISTNHRMI